MHSLRLPVVPPLHTSFKKHRLDSDPSRFSLNLSLSKPIPTPCWASLPSPPMSGSPPPEESHESSQVAGRRRKRSDTPPASEPSRAGFPATSSESPAQDRRIAQQRGAPLHGGIALQPPSYPSTYPVAQSYGYGPAPPTIVGMPSAALEGHFAPGQISPRPTRKTKAHVASACVNCKKKHLRCDNARPCRRCVQSGKETTCVDVEHKKRGRPPLKADENPRRPYETALSPLPGPLADQSRRLPLTDPSVYSQQRPPGSQRDIRPYQPQLQMEMGRPTIFRPGPQFQPIYAQPTVSSNHQVAMGTIMSQQRPFSSGSSAPSTQPPSPYYPSPVSAVGPGYEQVPRSIPPYATGYPYSSPQQPMVSLGQPSYQYPGLPRTSHQQQQHPMDAPPPRGYVFPHSMASDLQLPPIRPAPPGGLTDPAMAQQQRQVQQQQSREREEQSGWSGSTSQPDPKRPRMDIGGILGPQRD